MWDNAATTCYAALLSATASSSQLAAYNSKVVGLCIKFVDAGLLSSAGINSGGSTPSAGGSKASAHRCALELQWRQDTDTVVV